MSKIKLIIVVGLVFSGFILYPLQYSFGQLSLNKEYKDTGGRMPTADQLAKFHKTHARVTNVHLNTLGLYRINMDRAKKHLPLLDQTTAVPFGQEIESVKGDVATTTSSSGSSNAPGGPAPLLPSVDNATDTETGPFFPPIGNQASHLDCQSWATVYYQLTYMNALAKDLTVSNNDQTKIFSPRWVYTMINAGLDDGAWEGQDFAVLETNGAATLSEFTSLSSDNNLAWDYQNPTDWQNALSARINPVQIVSACTGNCTIPTTDTTSAEVTAWINSTYTSTSVGSWINTMKALLDNGYVLTFQNYIHYWQYSTITAADVSSYVGQGVAYVQTTVPCNTSPDCAENGCVLNAAGTVCSGTPTYTAGHVMTIVGYDDNITLSFPDAKGTIHQTIGAFKIANQWGTGYENGGFVWLAYDALYTTSQTGASFPAGTYDVQGYPTAGRTPAIWMDEAYILTVKQNYTPKLIAKFTVNQLQRGQLQMFLGTSASTASTPSTTDINVTTNPEPSALNQQGGPVMFPGIHPCSGLQGTDPTACNTPTTKTTCNNLATADGCYWIPASPGYTAECWGSCNNVSASTCSASVPAGCNYYGNSACWGTAFACSKFTPSTCSSQGGCSLANGVCRGTPTSCSSLSASVCNNQFGCESEASGTYVLDLTDFLPCAGTPVACTTISSPSACAFQTGCTWGNGACSGTAAACSTFSPPSSGQLGTTSCSSQLGCQSSSSGPLNFYLGMTDHSGACLNPSLYYLGQILDTSALCTAASGIWLPGTASTLSSYQLIDLTTNTTTSATGLPISASGNTVYSKIPYNFIDYTINASAGSNGTINPSGVLEVGKGASQTYTLTPNAGFTSLVSIDGGAPMICPTNSYTFSNVSGPHTIVASFVTYFLITANMGSGGLISPTGTIRVDYGTNETFTITPSAGYNISQVLVDNVAVVGVNGQPPVSYTFTNVTAAHTIVVSFASICPAGESYNGSKCMPPQPLPTSTASSTS